MKKLIFLILLIISACSTSSEGKLSILDNFSCKLPCWNNIIVGKTTEDELISFIESSIDVDKESVQNSNQPWNSFDNLIFFSYDKGWLLNRKPELHFEALITDNTVSDFIIWGELRVTLSEIVEIIGEPENIITGGAITGGKDVILIWSKIGVSLWYNTNEIPESLRAEVSPEIEICCLDLFDPNLYNKLLDAGHFSMGHYNAEETLKAMYPWNGYGNLNEKYPFRNPKQP